MSWEFLSGPATPRQLAFVNHILETWERAGVLPQFVREMLAASFIEQLHEAKRWLEKELAQQS